MTRLPRSEDRDWNEAEASIVSLERSSHRWELGETFFEQMLADLGGAIDSSFAELWVRDAAAQTTIATSGAPAPGGAAEWSQVAVRTDSAAPAVRWLGREPTDDACCTRPVLVLSKSIHHDLVLGLTLVFELPPEPSGREQLEDWAAASLEILAGAYLRTEHGRLRQQLSLHRVTDDLVRLVGRESTLSASAAALCRGIANATGSDRVSLLRVGSGGCCLLASSTQPRIDRRARQVRLMEAWVTACAAGRLPVHFVVGRGGQIAESVKNHLHAYLAEATVREVRLQWVASRAEPQTLLAAVLVENFTLTSGGNQRGGAAPPGGFPAVSYAAIGEAIAEAVTAALRQHDSAWLPGRWRQEPRRGRTGTPIALAAAAVLTLALGMVPVELRIKAQGRIVPAVSQRLFAPSEAVVTEVLVSNGQRVAQGDPLVALRSPSLDLTRQQVLGELAIAQVRLSTALASRTRGTARSGGGASGGGGQGTAGALGLSANEESLRVQLAGLEDQLSLLDEHLNSLQIVSPLDGVAHRWDLQQSLQNRPVVAGQHLLDVVATDRGWLLELEIPDGEIGYLLDPRATSTPRCRFHLRSRPELTHQGMITTIDRWAQVNSRGESFIRAVVPCSPDEAGWSGADEQEFPQTNAGVIAAIDCGKRPLAFVWLRGFFQWLRIHVGW